MGFEIYDWSDHIFSVCTATQEDREREHAFLFSGAMFEEDGKLKIHLKEKVSLDEYTLESDGGHIVFSKESLCASLKLMKETNQVFIFAHTHTDGMSRFIVNFSEQDRIFENTIYNLSKQYQYDLPLCFLVCDAQHYRAHVIFQDQYQEDIPVVFPFSNVSCDEEDIHITRNKKVGAVYSARKNILLQTTKEMAQFLKETQGTPKEKRKFSINWAILQQFVYSQFSKERDIGFKEPPSFLETGSLAKLEIMVQTSCNMACKYCYADGGHYSYGKKVLTPQKAQMYLKALIENKIKEIKMIQFFGGEPSLYPETIEAVCQYMENLVNRGVLISTPVYTMVTNLTVLPDKLVDIIKKYCVKLTVSLDGPQDINDELRVFPSGEGSHQLVLKNLEKLKHHGIYPAMIEATYTKKHDLMGYTKDRIEKYLQQTTGVNNVYVGDCFGNTEYSIEYGSVKEENKKPDKNTIYDVLQVLSQKTEISSWSCPAGAKIISLLPDGTIFPCHSFLPNTKYCIGIFEGGQWDFSKCKEQFEKIDDSSKNNCKCWAKKICQICPGFDNMFSDKTKKLNCQITREYLDMVLCLIAEKYR